MKTIRRDWLKKQIELGNIEAKCDYHLTDDYAFDNAYGFGKTGWMPARMSRPTYKTITLQNGCERDVCDNDDFIEGQMNFRDYQFKTKSGSCYQKDDGTIHFGSHSNESYTLRIKGS